MKEDDIHRLFMSVLDDPEQDTGAVRKVFSILVRSTLKYRDRILDSSGIILTVEDVQVVLGWLPPFLISGALPKTDHKIRLDLLKIWIDELDPSGVDIAQP